MFFPFNLMIFRFGSPLVFGCSMFLTTKLDKLGARLCLTKTNFINKCVPFNHHPDTWLRFRRFGLGKVEEI